MKKKNKVFYFCYEIWTNEGRQITSSDYLSTARDQMKNPMKYCGRNVDFKKISKETHHIRKVTYSYIK